MNCYTLQSHWRTQVKGVGQIEIDEIYVGVDAKGTECIIPVQAKRKSEKLEYAQLEQDIKCCAEKYPELECHPVGIQFMEQGIVVMFELQIQDESVVKVKESHYKLTQSGTFYISR